MNESCNRINVAQNAEVFCNRSLTHAKEQNLPRQQSLLRLHDGHHSFRSGTKTLISPRLTPIPRVVRDRRRLISVQLPPDPSDKTKTISSNALY